MWFKTNTYFETRKKINNIRDGLLLVISTGHFSLSIPFQFLGAQELVPIVFQGITLYSLSYTEHKIPYN